MRILITGASGLLGFKIAELAVKLGYEVYSGYLTHEPTHGTPLKLEIRDIDALRRIFDKVKPEVVIHTAALTDVDKCEIDKKLAWNINVEGTRNVAELSKRYEAFLVYVSTDYVFKGDKGMYRETEEANPVNYYGLTKLEGERRVIDILDEYCIARSSVIYGSRPASGKVNFALWIIERLRRGEAVNVLRDQWNSPTLNINLAEMIIEIAERKLIGIYHLAGATKVSRYEFASMIAEVFDLNKELIRPVTMNKLEWIAPRPRDSSLDVLKAMKTLRKKPNIIEEALRRLREEMES